MVLELAGREPFRLGNAAIDPLSREARWTGGEERLQPQTLKVLIVLASRREQVVTREELAELCWDGRIVGDDVINRSVSLARHVAARAGGFSIQTVPRAGYRLREDKSASRTSRRQRIALAGGVTAVIAMLVAGSLLTQRTAASSTLTVSIQHFSHDKGDEASRRLAAAAEDSSVRMLSESGISIEVADGKSREPPDFVLSGVISGSGPQGIATIRLEDPSRHSIILSRQIASEVSDPGALPDQVGANVAAALSGAEPLVRLDRLHPSNPAVLANVLNTNQNSFDSEQAFQRARRLAKAAPNSAVAQLALAWSTGLNVMVVPAAERPGILDTGRIAAERALSLAPDSGNSYGPWCLLHAEVRIGECEARLRKGLAVDSQDWSIGNVLSKLLLNVGRIDEAEPFAAEGLAKNAFAPGAIGSSLLALEMAGQTRNAEALFNRGHRLWPHSNGLIFQRLGGMLARADFDALARFEREVSGTLPASFPSVAGPLAVAVRGHSLAHAQAICGQIAGDDLPALECMLALAKLGDLDAAFGLARRVYPRRTGRTPAEEDAVWFGNPDNQDTLYLTASGAAPLRRDARFLQLADQLGLLRYWRSNGLPDFCTRAHEPVCVKIGGEARNG